MVTRNCSALALALLIGLPGLGLAIESESAGSGEEFLSKMNEVVRNIRETYPAFFKGESSDTLFVGAMNSVLGEVDPSGHSFVSAAQTTATTGVQPEVRVQMQDGVPIVSGITVHSSPYVSQLREGDILVEVNDTRVLGKTVPQIQELLAGPVASTVKLTVVHAQAKDMSSVQIGREPVSAPMFSRTVGDKLAFIQITRIDAAAAQAFGKTFETLVTEKIQGVVIDLRNTQGGGPDEAALIADSFLEGEEVAAAKVQEKDGVRTVKVPNQLKGSKVPVILIQNRGTAGAAEVLSACFQDHRRALVLGQKTSGYAGVRTEAKVSETHTVQFLTGVIQSPAGRQITGEGVVPDIAEKMPELTGQQLQAMRGEYSLFCQGLARTAKNPLVTVEAAAIVEEIPAGETPPEEPDTANTTETAPEASASPSPAPSPEASPAASPAAAAPEGDEEAAPEAAPDEAAPAEGTEGGEVPATPDEGEPEEERAGVPDLAKDYPLVKRYDTQLMRGVNLLISTMVFFEQYLKQ